MIIFNKIHIRNALLTFIVLAVVAVVSAGFVSGCSGAGGGGKDTIVIGSKKFSEQYILAHMMGLLIEEKTDLDTDLKLSLGGTMILHGAITKGEVDMYAEYSGTGLMAILNKDVIVSPEETYETVKKEYKEKFDITWLEPFGVNNAYTITVRKEEAEKHGWEKISDLKEHAADLRAGFEPEFIERPDGYPGMVETYGFDFKSVNEMDPGLMYKAIANGEVDVICAFATDGRIPAYNLKVLEDDMQFFPPYYAAPIVRDAVLEEHPEIAEALEPLGGLLDNETMQKLNFRVDEQHQDPRDIAREFLKKKKLID